MYVGSVPAPRITSVKGNLMSFMVVIIPPSINAVCINKFVVSILGSDWSFVNIIIPLQSPTSPTVAVINYKKFNLFPSSVVYKFRARVGINYSMDFTGE